MLASHTAEHGDVFAALCPILLVLGWALLLLGVLGVAARRPVLLDPVGSIVAAVILLVAWAVLC